MTGSQWHPEQKVWSFPVCDANDVRLKYLKGEINFDRYNRPLIAPNHYKIRASKLYEHQKLMVCTMLTRVRCEIAAEMGVGKSFAAIVAADIVTADTLGLILVVAPPAAQVEWLRQFLKFGYSNLLERVKFITYESIHKIRFVPQVLILDECVKIKNPSAQRSINTAEMCRKVREEDGYIWGLSGAPQPQDPSDWWHQLEVLVPGFLREGDPTKIKWALGEFKDGPFGKELLGWKEDEVARFAKRIAPVCLVLRKKDCLDLPDKIYDRIQCDLDPSYLEVALNIEGANAFETLSQLSDGFNYAQNLDIPNSPKERKLKELSDFYKDTEVPRIVVFAAYKRSIAKCYRLLQTEEWEVAVVDGDNHPSVDVLNRFLDSDYRKPVAFVCHPGAVHGLNFSTSPVLIYYSNSFNADHRIQSMERCDRIGKIGKGTRIIDLIHLETDARKLNIVEGKERVQNYTLEEIKKCLEEQKQSWQPSLSPSLDSVVTGTPSGQ